MGKILQILSIIITLAVISSRDYFYALGYRDDYPTIIGIGLAGIIFVLQRGLMPLAAIVVMVYSISMNDDTFARYKIDHDMIVAAGMMVAGYAWWNAYR